MTSAAESPHGIDPRIFEWRAQGMEALYSKDPKVKNPPQALEKFKLAAELGDPVSMDQLGGMYSMGIGNAPKSCEMALEWYEKSASTGYPFALNNLAYTLVTCDNKKLRDSDRAEQLMEVLFKENPIFIAILDTYAAVLAEQKNFKQATKTMEVTVDVAELARTNEERLDEFREALALYKKNKTLNSKNPNLHTPSNIN